MKRLVAVVLVLLAATAASPCRARQKGTAPCDGKTNLFSNSGFEEGQEAEAEGWSANIWGKGAGNVGRSKPDGATGEWAFGLQCDGESGSGAQLIGELVSIPKVEGTTLELTVSGRYSGNKHSQSCILRFYSIETGSGKARHVSLENALGKHVRKLVDLEPRSKWGAFEETFKIPAAAAAQPDCAFRLYLCVTRRDRILVDDLRLTAKRVPVRKERYDFSKWNIEDCPDLTPEEAALNPKIPGPPFKLGIERGVFTRNGKPYFLLGTPTGACQWSIKSTWYPRVFKFDFVTRADSGLKASRITAEGDTLDLQWTPVPWWASHVSEIYRNKLFMWDDFASSSAILRYCRTYRDDFDRFPSIGDLICREFGHYYPYDHNNALGLRLYTNDFKAYLRYGRDVDLLAIELFNEIGYACFSPLTLDAFRKYAEEKYASVAEANRIWRTSFRDWRSVKPPHLWVPVEGYWELHRYKQKQAGEYPEIYNDWIEFLRMFFVKGLGPMVEATRKLNDRNPRITIQARFQSGSGGGYETIDLERIVPKIDFMAHQVSTLKFYNRHGRPMGIEDFKDTLLRLGLYHDYGRALCKKPLLNSEGITNGNFPCEGSEEHMIESSIAPLHTTWKFKTDPKERGITDGWYKQSFDESGWDAMPVPGVWEDHNEKYARYDGWAWYKTRFVVPRRYEAAKEDGSVRYCLVGKGLDDEGTFYFNDAEVFQGEGGDAEYHVDVSDDIKFGEENTLGLLINDIHQQGGPRFFVTLVGDNNMVVKTSTTPGQLAHLYWNSAVRGFSGINHWLCWDENIQTDIPRIKTDMDSVAPILLPRPRIKGKVALMYSFESFMGLLTMQTGASDVLDYYGSPVFHQIPLDILSNRQLIAGKASDYPLLLIPYAHIVRRGTMDALRNYIANGGHVVMTYDSFLRNDWHYESLPVGELIGARIVGEIEEGAKVNYKGESFPVVKGSYTGKFGVAIEPVDAETVATYDNGEAAVTYRRLGKGGIWFVGAEMEFMPTHRLIGDILDHLSIKGDVALTFEKSEEWPYVEAQVIGKQDKFLLYLVNWGGIEHRFRLKFAPAFFADKGGKYLIRELQCKDSPIHGQTRSVDDLVKGVDLHLGPEDPRVIVFESTETTPIEFAILSKKRQAILDRLEAMKQKSRVVPEKPAVVFLTEEMRPGNDMRGKMGTPVLVQLLEDHGFQVHDVYLKDIRPDVLARFQVAIILEDCCNWWNGVKTRHPTVYPLLQEFVENGGGLLVAGTGYVHGNAGSTALRSTMSKYGIGGVSGREMPYCRDPSNCAFGDPIQVTFNHIAEHPITTGVRTVQTFCTRPLIDKESRLAPIVTSAESDLIAPSMPVVLAGEIGKGRVVACGDCTFAQPFRIEIGDNAQFALNCIMWLSRQKPKTLTKEELARSFFISERIMEEIEHDERGERGPSVP